MERLLLLSKLYSIPDEIKHIVLLTAVRAILYSAINLFLPAYLAYAYDIKTAILFMSIQAFFVYTAVSLKVFSHLIKQFSLEIIQISSIFIGIIGLIVVFLVKGWVGLLIGGFLLNLQNVLYWMPKHYAIVKFAKKKDEMEESVIVDNVGRIISFLTPLVSSYIIYFMGYSFYYAAITFIIVSLLIYVFNRIRRKSTYVHDNSGFTRKYIALFFLEGIVAGTWLVATTAFLYYNLDSSITFYGTLRAVGTIATLIMTYYVAKLIDSKHNLKISTFSLVVLAFSVYAFSYMHNFIYGVAIIAVLISFFYNLGSLTPMAFMYEHAKILGTGVLLTRELVLSAGRSVILFLSAFSQELLVVGAMSILLYAFMMYVSAVEHKRLLRGFY